MAVPEPRVAEQPPPDPLGAVLMGGQSRRMGRDKATLPLGGVPLAELVARVLEQVLDQVVLVAAKTGDPRLPGRRRLVDRFRDCGPLAGLHAALLHASTGGPPAGGSRSGRPVLLAACDLPAISPELVRHVAGPEPGVDDQPWARVPEVDGRLQPLFALYGPGCLPLAEERLRRGRLAMHDFLDALAVTRLPLTPDLPWYQDGLLTNLNRPEDVRAFEEDIQPLNERP